MSEQQIAFDFGDEFKAATQYMTIEKDKFSPASQYVEIDCDMKVEIKPKERTTTRVYTSKRENQDIDWLNALPKTAADAKKVGSKKYFTGQVCPNGHLAARITNTYGCTQCAYESEKRWEETSGKRSKKRETSKANNERIRRQIQKQFSTGAAISNRVEVDPPLLSRADAIKDRMLFYFTGRACSNGHIAQRYTKADTCVECSKKYNERRNNVSVVKVNQQVSVAKYEPDGP